MNILEGQHWVVIPSRANSQRFHNKALAELSGETLIDRAIRTARKTLCMTNNIVVSTNDHELIKKIPPYIGIHVRPDEYAESNTRIDDTLIDLIYTLKEVPEYIHLVQLTSPFIKDEHILTGLNILHTFKYLDSVQLIAPIPNAYHAYSQRVIDGNRVGFKYPIEREECYNSQLKPKHYAFCGYIGFKTASLLKYNNIWGKESMPIVGSSDCLIDIDTPEDMQFAEFILEKGNKE